jgi:hypothetical protein
MWLKECGGAERGLRLAAALERFWWFRGYYIEGRVQLGEFLRLGGAAPVRAKALYALGVLIYRSADYSAGDQGAALSRLEGSLEIYRELGEERRTATVLREIGRLRFEVGDWERARSFLYLESVEAAKHDYTGGSAMREVCFCGRAGKIEDRQPILDSDVRWVLICPECGHVDHLTWLSEEAGLLVWSEARHRQEGPSRQSYAG